jgi:hypothetical protein
MPDEMSQHIVRQCLSLENPQPSEVALLLMLRRVCKCWRSEVHESVLQVHERVLEVQKRGALKKINPTLNNVAEWMVLAALSAARSTGATLTSVRMTIYSMAYNIYTNSMHIKPPHLFEVVEWPVIVSERISRVLELGPVRLPREQILKILVRKNISPIVQRKKLEKACARLISLQAVYRGFSQEKKYKQARALLVRLQAVYRGFSQQHKYKQARARPINLTAIVEPSAINTKASQHNLGLGEECNAENRNRTLPQVSGASHPL